ncbi:hypothetical protein PRNP1_003789 [Phytophthora ramorum]
MADASDIYRRFVEAPLRLKPRKPSPSPPSTPPACTQQYDASSPWGDSPAFSTRSKEVRKLRRRVAKIKISTSDAAIPRDADGETPVNKASDMVSSAGVSSADAADLKSAAETGSDAARSLLKKKKRVTRSVSIKNQDTGGEFVDTPTKASQPPKRIRKFSRDLGSKKDKKTRRNVFAFNLDGLDSDDEKQKGDALEAGAASGPRRRGSVTITVPVRRSRRLQHIKAESPKLAAVLPSRRAKMSPSTCTSPLPLKSQESAIVETVEAANPDSAASPTQDPTTEVPVDLVSPFCDSLLATDTISGCFFALSLNALRDAQPKFISKSTSSDSNPLESVFTICLGIAECEKLAQLSFPSKSPRVQSSTPSKSPKSSKAELPGQRRRSSLKKGNKSKKNVRFRSFDLSCLNLQYVDDEQVAVMVDKILTRYGTIMEHVETMISSFDAGSDELVLLEIVRVMASPAELYTAHSNLDVADASKRIYRCAYGGRDLYSQHEIRISGEYFSRQFANLLVSRASRSSPPQFLQSVFSSLASSSIRFKLRVLFVESEDFGEDVSGGDVLQNRVLLDEDGKTFPAMAPYEHQDLGAAIHWALQESVLYWPLVQPLQDMLDCEEGCLSELGEESRVKKYLDESGAEDLDHMEKYVLARRFLRFHLTKSWRHRLKNDGDTAKIWASVEKVCTVAKRFHFEDETHLFPLASIEELVARLAREEPTLQRMEEILQSFYEQKYGVSALQSEPCMECHHVITREETPTSIRCTSCARRFHLGCLHLPESFAQFAEHYTCPACFLGRGGY